MKRGLVIGKFLPIHQGHIALIEFAAAQCDELIVSMSYTLNDPIPAALRFSWIVELFQDNPKIKPHVLLDDFDDESLDLPERTRIWADVIRKHYPPIHLLFSSESYGDPFARNLNAAHIQFDPARKFVPVSASQIRSNPFQYWNFIPEVVRPHFVKKVCFYGPESTGKSTMAATMAKKFNTEFVPEVAREMLITNDFSIDDIIRIGKAQTQRVHEKTRTANKILFCDTDLITTQIYSQHYLGTVPQILYDLEKEVNYDVYFLMDINTEWIADGLRDLGHLRQEMFETFKKALDDRNIPYIFLTGEREKKEQTVVDTIKSLQR
jgi:HTH-type transcriptional regulator, transcriptional repressor of NAD biosynthesis genes